VLLLLLTQPTGSPAFPGGGGPGGGRKGMIGLQGREWCKGGHNNVELCKIGVYLLELAENLTLFASITANATNFSGAFAKYWLVLPWILPYWTISPLVSLHYALHLLKGFLKSTKNDLMVANVFMNIVNCSWVFLCNHLVVAIRKISPTIAPYCFGIALD
jgi:hypothetical protein